MSYEHVKRPERFEQRSFYGKTAVPTNSIIGAPEYSYIVSTSSRSGGRSGILR